MKKAASLILAAIAASVAAGTSEIRCDSAFDNIFHRDKTSFVVNEGMSKEAVFRKETDEKRGSCLYVKTTEKKGAEFFLFCYIPVEKGKSSVRFSVMAKGTGRLTICAYCYGANRKYQKYHMESGRNRGVRINSPDWTKYTFDLDCGFVNDDTKYIFIAFHPGPNSELYFDDFAGTVTTAE